MIELPEAEPKITALSVPFSIVKTKKMEETGENTYKLKKNASMILQFDPVPDSETYIFLKNITYNGAERDVSVGVKSGDTSRKSEIHRIGSLYDFEREGITFNLGYSEDGFSECTISFTDAGTYSFEPEVICLPMSDYERDAAALHECVMENIKENGDVITGTIDADKTRLLTFTVPNYGGWTCYIDGEKAELIRVNTMYMGTVIGPGKHDIRLSYTIPGLKAGAGISGVSLIACIAMIAGNMRNAKNRKPKEVSK